MFTYIKKLFSKPKEIYIGSNMKNSHYFSLILFTGLILSFLSFFEILPTAQSFQADFEEIQSSIPTFELIDNRLESNTESYVYQTDNIMFYFDSQNKINQDTIDKNMKIYKNPISIGFLKTNVHFNFLGTTYSFSYDKLSNLSANDLTEILNSMTNFSVGMSIFFLLTIYILNSLLFISELIPITLMANVISVYRKTGLKFFQNAKIALLATIGPSILIYLLNAFNIQVFYEFEILLISSLLLFYTAISEFKHHLEK